MISLLSSKMVLFPKTFSVSRGNYLVIRRIDNSRSLLRKAYFGGWPWQVQVIRSSLPYEVLLYLNGWYFGLFFICEILLFAYKGETLPYANGVLAAEVILVFILAGIEALRLFFARKGNLTEKIVGVIVSILLSIPPYWVRYSTCTGRRTSRGRTSSSQPSS